MAPLGHRTDAAFKHAAALLAALDATFEPHCALSASGSPACERGIRAARSLAELYPLAGWDGALHGCPHINSTVGVAMQQRKYVDYCLSTL